ncbi:MAG: hypothetical protein ACM3IH_20590 [Sphingobacteriales bacterium]|jgi:hypothetical protein
MTKTDLEALQAAMEAARGERPERAAQLDSMLKDRSWTEVAEFAAYCAQIRSLRLKPWQSPPCAVLDGEENTEAGKLLAQILEHNVSMYHPDPLAAIAAAKASAA